MGRPESAQGMPKQFNLLVFDWDGTLLDSAGTIVSAIQAAFRDLGLPPPPEERARHVIGLGLNEAIAELLPQLAGSEYGRVVERYRHHYLSRDHEILLFDGAVETIVALHQAGFILAVATGKSRRGLERAFEHSGLGPYFHSSRCADESFSKPHPGMLQELMDELGMAPQETLMIGDTSHDLLMARNAGVKGLGVAHGAHSREGLLACGPLACVDDMTELRQWLAGHA